MKQTLLLLLSVFALSTQASVVTKDINYSLTAGVYQVDLNNNGTKDLFFRLKYDSGTGTIYCRFGVVDLNGSVDNQRGYDGDAVGQNAYWMDSMNIFTAPGGFIDVSSWCPSGDTCYFGFVFAEGSNLYFGYVQVQTVSANNLRIIRASYNNTDQSSIDFGDIGTTSIHSTAAEEKASISFAANEISVMAEPATLEGAQVLVRDLTGRVCAAKEISSTDNRLPINEPSGIYIVSVSTKKGNVVSRKVVVQ